MLNYNRKLNSVTWDRSLGIEDRFFLPNFEERKNICLWIDPQDTKFILEKEFEQGSSPIV